MNRIRKRLTFANVVSCLALFVALGGASYAATQLPKNSVGTKQIKSRAVTPAKLSRAAKKTLTGPQGEPGKSATALWAEISAGGGLGKSSHTVSARKFSPITQGVYEVFFDQDVSGCTYQATVAQEETAAFIDVEPLFGHADGVFVEVLDKTGTNLDAQFDLAVFC
jgi:hypothetical protein